MELFQQKCIFLIMSVTVTVNSEIYSGTFVFTKLRTQNRVQDNHFTMTSDMILCSAQCDRNPKCLVVSFDVNSGICLDNTEWTSSPVNENGTYLMLANFRDKFPYSSYLEDFDSFIMAIEKSLTYHTALAECKSELGPLAHVIWIQTLEKNDILLERQTDINKPGSPIYYWIGFTDEVEEGNFQWDWGTGIVAPYRGNFTNWKPSEPNNQNDEDCVGIVLNAGWSDVQCHWSMRPICELNLL